MRLGKRSGRAWRHETRERPRRRVCRLGHQGRDGSRSQTGPTLKREINGVAGAGDPGAPGERRLRSRRRVTDDREYQVVNSRPIFRPSRQVTMQILSMHKSADTKRRCLKYDDIRSASITAPDSSALQTRQLCRSCNSSKYNWPVFGEDPPEVPRRSSVIARLRIFMLPEPYRRLGQSSYFLSIRPRIEALETADAAADARGSHTANRRPTRLPSRQAMTQSWLRANAAEMRRSFSGSGTSKSTSIIAPNLLRS